MRRGLAALLGLGLMARVAAFALRPSLHPDEIFQYLEPAWLRLHGYGWPAWEWAAGLRSWVLPGYHGAWMALLERLGVREGSRAAAFLQLHWAVLSLAVVPAAFRAAAALAGERAGLVAAALCALLPELLWFAPHTLTELPAALLATWGLAFHFEGRRATGRDELRSALRTGVLLSFAVCLRLPDAPLSLVPVLDLLLRRRFTALGALAAAALGPIAFFGAVDWLTWGKPFHSALAFLEYNLVEGRAGEHGISPAFEYLALFWDRTSGAIALALLVALWAVRASWPALLPALLLIAALSTQPHKEERFALAAWPLLAIALAAAARPRRWALPAALVAGALLLAGNAAGLLRMPAQDYSGRAGLYDAEAWVGRQPDATGLLVEGRFHLSGGFVFLSRDLPLETFDPALVADPIFSHAAVRDGGAEELRCARLGWQRAWSARGFSVFRRR